MSINSTEIMEKVQEIIMNYSDAEIGDPIRMDFPLSNFSISSIKFIKIIIDIETEFNIEFDIDDIDIEKFQTIGDLVGYIENITNKS